MEWVTPKTDWTPADGVADDDFNRIEGNIRVLDVSLPGLNVKRFGALGDGSRNNESPYLQAALDAGAGTEIYIPSGIYYLQDTLIAKSGTKIRLHPEARLIRNAEINMLILWDGGNPTGYNGAHDIVVEGGIWDMNMEEFPSANTGITFSHAQNIIIKDVTMLDCPENHHLEINASRNVKVQNCTFVGMTVTGTRRSECVQIDGAFREAVFPWHGAYDNTVCSDIQIIGCTFRDADRGIGTHSVATNSSDIRSHDHIRISGCHFENLGGQAIRSMVWQNVTIIGNTFRDCRMGCELKTGPGDPGMNIHCHRLVVTGNTFYNMTAEEDGRAIWFNGYEDGNFYDVVVSDNTIRDTNTHGIYLKFTNRGAVRGNRVSYPGTNGISIYDQSTYCTIEGNSVSFAEAQGISLFNSSHDCVINDNRINGSGEYGIVVNGCSRSVISGNSVRSTSDNGIYVYDSPSTNVEGNTISNAGMQGVSIYESNYFMVNSNNISFSSQYGVALNSGQGTCCNNLISHSGEHGLLVTNGVQYSTINGNVVNSSSQNEAEEFDGIRLSNEVYRSSVIGNVVRQNASVRSRYGISITNTCERNIVAHNNAIFAGEEAEISDNGIDTATLAGNVTTGSEPSPPESNSN